ncbi:MAG TPA: hypothetical protein VGI56_11820 [Galbitalea sp.]|jgi:hypothetical protein
MSTPFKPGDSDGETPLRDELLFGSEDLEVSSDNQDTVDEDVREAQEINRHLRGE